MNTNMNPHLGSSFDDFLAEEALLEETTAVAIKRVVTWQIEQEMKSQKLTKTALAAKMHTSRAALNRLLDETDTSLTLTTLTSAANALGKSLRIELAG
ncbi:MAG: helix-turn-helix domain-containing protein [Gammaproteobacteria bacterium]|jgi:DNA-binding Xre family transcriptional regulator|nr:helix-turn-helix domain-containing protein [Gammaproteobacteria bacterium]MCL5796373.1 helix-turn-helix domain-containing protein [Gammaproteobacteria bacterium]